MIIDEEIIQDELVNKAHKIARLNGWTWNAFKVGEMNSEGFYVEYWVSEFRKPRWLFISKLIHSCRGFTCEDATRMLLDEVSSNLAKKSLSYLTMKLAIEKGEL